jgi:hypothetical protein
MDKTDKALALTCLLGCVLACVLVLAILLFPSLRRPMGAVFLALLVFSDIIAVYVYGVRRR